MVTPLYYNSNKKMLILEKRMSTWMCFIIGHIERIKRWPKRFLLSLQIKKEKFVLS
jgi:hypothetical protein